MLLHLWREDHTACENLAGRPHLGFHARPKVAREAFPQQMTSRRRRKLGNGTHPGFVRFRHPGKKNDINGTRQVHLELSLLSRGRGRETVDVIMQTGRIIVYFNQVFGGMNTEPFLRFAATRNTLYGFFCEFS